LSIEAIEQETGDRNQETRKKIKDQRKKNHERI